MKPFATVSIFAVLSFLLVSVITEAQIQSYSVDSTLDNQNKLSVKEIITFDSAEKTFEFSMFGMIENFKASSNAGPVDCKIKSTTATIVTCSMNLTSDKRTLEMTYETPDFVKTISNRFYFNGDFSIYKNISYVYFAVKLPEGMVISQDESIIPVLPKNYQTASDGRRIIVQWNLENISSSQSLKFQVVYEALQPSFIGFNLTQLLIVSIIAAGGTGFFLYRRIKKPKEVILSVLDEHERKVIEILTTAGGETNQKKIVQETNLSKAKVSRIVKSLSERGLVEVKRIGRTNKLKLVKAKFSE